MAWDGAFFLPIVHPELIAYGNLTHVLLGAENLPSRFYNQSLSWMIGRIRKEMLRPSTYRATPSIQLAKRGESYAVRQPKVFSSVERLAEKLNVRFGDKPGQEWNGLNWLPVVKMFSQGVV